MTTVSPMARRGMRNATHGLWRVLRFTNPDVLGNLNGVLQTIAAALADPLTGPLPEGEGEEA